MHASPCSITGLRLPMMKFVHSVLTFYKAPLSVISGSWLTVLGFEALCDLYALKVCQLEVFSVAYSLRKTIQGARYFSPKSGVEKLLSTWSTTIMVRDTVVGVTGP